MLFRPADHLPPAADRGVVCHLDLDAMALARALSMSSLWGDSLAALIVRPPPNALLSALGYFDEAVQARLDDLCWRLLHGGSEIRYVGYRQAERDCVQLAANLRERWSLEELRRFRYVAIPRGGLVVLGMLSYVLDLPHSALAPHDGPDRAGQPLVVIDDCALSGARFRMFLRQCEHRPVIFAHLYSHPQLRAAIEGDEGGVLVVSAHDLRDHAPEVFGQHYEAWRDGWRARVGNYWVGQTEPLCFAWNEPDVTLWNPAAEQVERGWRLVPEEVCLKNRLPPGGAPVPVQVQPVARGPLVPAVDVVFGKLAGRLVVGNAQTGEAVALDSVAADMWEAIVAYGDEDAAAAALIESYDVARSRLRSDLARLVGEATARGLLTREW
ncbi:MAG: PqqD family peptide modification chaperone [Egibacteraceae bacterium]